MLFETDDLADPVDLARMLAVQAELLALNAAIESARGGPRGAELCALAEEARQLARSGREAGMRHERLAKAEREAGRILDEGLAGAPIELDDAATLSRLSAAAAGRLIRGAERAERSAPLTH